MTGRILVVDDDRELCELIVDGLGQRDFVAAPAFDADSALESLRTGSFDVVVLDVRLGKDDGIELGARIIENHPGVYVVIMTGHGDLQTAISAIRAGAYDFITKPFKIDALTVALQRAIDHGQLTAEVKRLRQVSNKPPRSGTMVGESALMLRAYDLISQVAHSDATVLVTGESGTGKELVARAIHDASPRKDQPFVALNCAAVSASLLESELFGHVRGAFTDARTSREGLFIKASGGTLFLDEIGEMAAEMQAKLLRVLQESRVRPVGGDDEIAFDTRIVAATNRDLESAVEQGAFREDLYYRINVVRIPLPPLRSRGKDILVLAQHFLDENARQANKAIRGFSRAAAEKLLAYDWPGNVRELQNCIERAVTLSKFDELTPADFPERISTHRSSRIVISGDDPEEMPTLEEVESRYVARVLEAVQHNKSHAARVLGVDRRTLYRRLERLNVPVDDE